ncbi:histidine kinase [Phytohabitans sp. ZYX-F-186]|uniref:histidine kinase n=1 Tax=Phytohabitans maris TaxID=3071409 RepID=A0ABU0ZKT9_9ACTN|nr:histidine kinase [Phytohabitans sp. ZYX-F-186]MDQ7907598.1 histidine kinase [Phytohabitans sp. ZYX-F-186]
MWTAQRARVLGWQLAAPSLLLAVTALVLDTAGGWPQVAAEPPTVVGAVNGTVLALVGALIIDHQPRNGTGWIISVTGLLLAGMGFCDGLAVTLDPAGVAGPAATWVWAANTLGMIAFAAGPPLLLLFPDGRPLHGRWRPVLWATAVVAAVTLVVQAVGAWTARGPALSAYHLSYIDSLAAAPAGFAFAVWGERVLQLGWLVGLAALVARYRRARGTLRQQLSWALLGLGGTVLILTVGYVVVGPGVQLVALIPLVAGVLIAMRRHRLFDADRLLRRAIVYITLTVLLVGGFATLALGIGTVAGAGFDAGASVAVAAATLAAAAAANPLRRGLQRQLDRRFDHHTWQAITAVEAFTRHLRDGSATPRNLTGVLQAALADPSVRVVYYLPDGSLIDDDGHPAEPHRPDRLAQVVSVGGRRIALVDMPRTLAEAEPRLVEAALSTAALPLENAALHARAATQLAEVQDSRRRIVDAGDAERRRIERDLHDGAQQRLVASIVRLRRLERRLAGHDPQTVAELDTTVNELRTCLAELRNLARGVLPPVLADEGLAVALRTVTARLPLPVDLDVTSARLPPTVEATVWFLVNEGLTNAIKHAQPGQLSASVHHHSGHVRVEVTDDGAGGATLAPGGGLQGLADRVAAIGGRFEIRSPPAAGTTLVAELPCAS